MRPFAGRVSIVTGGTRGIGAAITTRLVREGAHVAAVYEQRVAPYVHQRW